MAHLVGVQMWVLGMMAAMAVPVADRSADTERAPLDGLLSADELGRPVPLAPSRLRPAGMPTLPIVNGTVDTANTYKNVVMLGFGDNRYDYGSFCSGSLIDPYWVLTAAHCVAAAWDYTGYGLSPYVYQGKSESNYVVRAKVVESYMHPSYNDGSQVVPYDIALLQLQTPITGVDLMILSPDAARVGDVLTFAGYGITS